jgi:peroxiredoxin
MVVTPSRMGALGSAAPDFVLPDVTSGRQVTRDACARPRGLLVMFLCRHCPYVKHVETELARLGRDYADATIGIVAVSSNDAAAHPDDAPGSLKEQAAAAGFTFPYLYDEAQAVARAYGAACTPDFFLYDGALRLAYRGQLDDSRPGNGKPVTGRDLRDAMDALLAGRPVAPQQRASVGCNIKWRPGNEPV